MRLNALLNQGVGLVIATGAKEDSCPQARREGAGEKAWHGFAVFVRNITIPVGINNVFFVHINDGVSVCPALGEKGNSRQYI